MQVKTFGASSTKNLDDQINAFFDSWSNETGVTYHLIDVRFCGDYRTNSYSAMIVYNKQDNRVMSQSVL